MPVGTVLSRAQFGVEAPLVRVEATIGSGLPAFSIVGLPAAVVKESKDRVRAAIVAAGFEFPVGRLIVNLAPADLPKEGGRFDLPIALALLVADGRLPQGGFEGCEFYGELSLTGELRSVRGLLAAVWHATRYGSRVVIPQADAAEAALVKGSRLCTVAHVLDICAHLNGSSPWSFHTGSGGAPGRHSWPDLADVRGQSHAVRALEIAAAGGHSLLMCGPPGSGKSMLAHRFPGILPPLSETEAMETAAVMSVSARGFRASDWAQRPFRTPHHTASAIAMVGGGVPPRPGEISLAHRGVLFLDELPEFDRYVLEVLREPLESGSVTISRGARQAEFPAQFQLIAAMNPCPCGFHGDPSARCRCTPAQVLRYRERISGPLLDRIDVHVEVPRPDPAALVRLRAAEESAAIAKRVFTAREIQWTRSGKINVLLDPHDLERYCGLTAAAQRLISDAMSALRLSARSYHRLLKLARTISDLDGGGAIEERQASEAVQLRRGLAPLQVP